jgi:hypothetical protein
MDLPWLRSGPGEDSWAPMAGAFFYACRVLIQNSMRP